MQKQKLLFEQSRLCSRGAAEMALMYISASNGQCKTCVLILNGFNIITVLVSFNYPFSSILAVD